LDPLIKSQMIAPCDAYARAADILLSKYLSVFYDLYFRRVPGAAVAITEGPIFSLPLQPV
jgi:hypothetical protein